MSHTSFAKSKIKILLLENISQQAIILFQEQGFQVECLSSITFAELKEKIVDVHAIGIRSKTKINQEVLLYAKKLLCVGCFCIGTDQTDLISTSLAGIPVFNSPYSNTRSVAELVLGEMISLGRKMTDKSLACHQGIWSKNSQNCIELRGKTLGIVGYGHVGSQLSILAEALGMNVYYYDIIPVLSLGNAKKVNSLEELLSSCQFISLHVPKTPETVNMIGYNEIFLMRKGSYLLNASRGDVVVIDAVAKALEIKHLAGVAFDVFPNEPSNNEAFVSVLQNYPNTILTPHIGGSTEEAQDAIGMEVAQKMISFINEGSTIESVNFPEIKIKKTLNSHIILNVHHNIQGFMSEINTVLSQYNIIGQVLGTNSHIGYLIIELEKEVSEEIKKKLSNLKQNIKTRVLF